jgi:hypothetical protein
MNTEHNPIAVLVSKVQRKWNEEVHPSNEYKLVRWIIRSEQARLYEGFLKLESSSHGSIPEVFVVLLTPFEDKKTFSKKLIVQWLEQYKADKAKAEKENPATVIFSWDFSEIEKQLELKGADPDALLMEMLHAFQQTLADKKTKLVLALLPGTVSSVNDYSDWLNDRLKQGIPEHVRISIFDYEDERHFDDLFKRFQHSTKSLAVPMDIQAAIGKLARMGDPNSPEVQFRTCMQEMGDAVAADSLPRLEKWGTKALEIGQRSGKKGFFASAHIIYAGMLFSFKTYEQIGYLLEGGLRLAQLGLEEGDETCKVLIMQFYAYQAACKQHEGKDAEAADLFVRQGELAIQFGFGVQALTPWWQAYNLYHKKNEKSYTALLEQTYTHGTTCSTEELANSCIGYIAFDYHDYLSNLKQTEKCKVIDAFMKNIEGENWKEKVEKYKNDTKHKKRFLFI